MTLGVSFGEMPASPPPSRFAVVGAVLFAIPVAAGMLWLTGRLDTEPAEVPSGAMEGPCRRYNSDTVGMVSCGALEGPQFDACLLAEAERLGRPWRDCNRCGDARRVEDCPRR